ncbi:MAG: ArnT family glycosyltransferase [Anaerolineae bacterium]
MTSGYASLVTGDYRLVEEHPPLIKMLEALPLLLQKPPLPDPRTVEGWEEANLVRVARKTYLAQRPLQPVVYAARVPVMLIGVLLGAFVYRWAADEGGAMAGLMALFLYTFEPNMLAHAGVATTDFGVTAGVFVAAYAFWRWLRSDRRSRRWFAGFTLGLALTTKLTASLLVPVFVLMLFLSSLRVSREQRSQVIRRRGIDLGLMGLTAFLTLWAVYRFEIRQLEGWPFPIPAASHLLPVRYVLHHLDVGHTAFIMGKYVNQGVWYYFPIAFLLKTPVPLLILGGIEGLSRLTTFQWSRIRVGILRPRFVAVLFTSLYAGASMISSLNIGYRHLLPISPFLFVIMSRLTRFQKLVVTIGRPKVRYLIAGCAVLVLLGGWYVVGTLRMHPFYLSYFNELAGGPDNGYNYLVDSNLDWGQTWIALREYLEDQGIERFYMSQFTMNDPAAYGLTYDRLPPFSGVPPILPSRFNPTPGTYAISTTTLQGVGIADPEQFDYFRKLEPDARIGHALFVYHIEPQEPQRTWIAQCNNPVVPIPANHPDFHAFGLDNPRQAYFDCVESWLYPTGGAEPGWYVLHRHTALHANTFTQAHLSSTRLSYEQRMPHTTPPFAVYQQSTSRVKPEEDLVYPAPSTLPPVEATHEAAVSPPLVLDGPLDFLGYTLLQKRVKSGQEIEFWTYWRVTTTPTQPLSLMAHLLGDDGRFVTAGDGLGVPITEWRTGDVLVQRHRLLLPVDVSPGRYWLQSGAYWLETLERWSVLDAGQPIGDRIVLTSVRVEAP